MIEKTKYLDFLDETYPGIKANIARCALLGFPWTNRPFIKEEKGEVLSHVAFMEYPLKVEGKDLKVGALHAICTKNTHRGQGLARELIKATLQWAKDRYECVVLFTEIPKFYEKLSFHHIQEHRFHLKSKHSKGSQSIRQIIFPEDNALFLRCYSDREPVSDHFWVKDHGNIASFNSLFATFPKYWSLYYSPMIDGFISFIIEDKTLHLFDIVAQKIPSLDIILDHLPSEIEEIYFYFSPDRLSKTAKAEPFLYHDSGYFMAYGNWPKVKPFMIAPLYRC